VVLGFFFVVLAGALIVFALWIFPGGLRLGSIIFAACYCAFWLYSKFTKRG
jgi:hypothetical protein